MHKSDTPIKLTTHQRKILQGLADGGMLILDKHNILNLGETMLQSITRSFLTENRLIERLDKKRSTSVQGNGFIISEKGRAALRIAATRSSTPEI